MIRYVIRRLLISIPILLIGSIAVLTMVWITLRGSWLWYVSRQAASPDATSGTASQ